MNKRDFKNFFTAEDFNTVFLSCEPTQNAPSTNELIEIALKRAALKASAILRDELERTPRAYTRFGNKDCALWQEYVVLPNSGITHTARLVDIEEIKK